ncbi:MAG: PASTA domain-containing protein [Sphingobacterium sp.]
MGLIDAIYAMENAGFKTSIKGKGNVVNQSLVAGQNLKPGTNVLIELN